MSRPSKRTSPSTRAPGTVSCMRFRQRSSVDLPQPDGPMIAVTCPARTPNATSRTTRDPPKYASSAATSSADTASSVAAESEAGPGDVSRGEADDENEAEEDECARPGLRMPVFIGGSRIVVDVHGE